MVRLALMAAALVASSSLFCTMTTPALAQYASDDDGSVNAGELRDFLMDELRARRDRRDALLDLVSARRERRDALLDLIRERRDWRAEASEGDRGELRERLRDRLRERIAERRDEDGWRGRLRERIAERRDEDGWRGRLRERIAERNGDDDCFFLTRSLRDADGNFVVLVSRRVCRD